MDVVVCTSSRQRIRLLQETLKSLELQTYDPFGVILVVDHNPELAAELSTMAGGPLRVRENLGPRGLSGARNSGVTQSQAPVVAFIDDDATAEPTWLECLVRYFDDATILAVGGKVVPVWDGGRKPKWLPEEFLWVVGCSFRGMPDGGPVRNVIGCNMSFRSLVFETVGTFNPDVGRLGTQPLGCEETELCIRAQRRWPERKIIYTPEAIVYHHVPRTRQTFGYFLRRCYSEGLSKAMVRRLAGSASLGVEGQYVTATLGPAVLRNLAGAVLLRDVLGSLGRAFAICIGLSATGAGFLVGSGRPALAARFARRTRAQRSSTVR